MDIGREYKTMDNDLSIFLKFIQKNDKLAIYGTGEAARIIFRCVTNSLRRKIDFFIDEYNDNGIFGINIKKLEDTPRDISVIIAANPRYNTEMKLLKYGLSSYVRIDPGILYYYCMNNDYLKINEKILKQNKFKIEHIKRLLSDKLSIEIFDEMLNQRICPRLTNISKYVENGQYFGNDVIPQISGGIVDCGAYNGDTFKRFLNQTDIDNWKYFAFETDEDNYKKLKAFASNEWCVNKLQLYHLAVWDKTEQLIFENPSLLDEKTSGKILSNYVKKDKCIEVNGDMLDNVLKGQYEDINLITMDIEGAEINALNGASKIIQERKPMLAISIYHITEHLYKIPALIHQLNPDYKLFIRHHRWNTSDTVCYAI